MNQDNIIPRLIQLTYDHCAPANQLELERLISEGFKVSAGTGTNLIIPLNMGVSVDSPDSRHVDVHQKEVSPQDFPASVIYNPFFIVGTLDKKTGHETLTLPAGFDHIQRDLEERGYQPPKPQPQP